MLWESLAISLGLEGDIQVVGQAANAEEAIQKLKNLSVDVVLMDIRLPGMGVVEAIHLLKERLPGVKIVVVTLDREEDLGEVLEAGAVGCVSNMASPNQLAEAIRAAARGQSYVDTALACTLVQEVVRLRRIHKFSLLSLRQTQILRMIASGARYAEIAKSLNVSKTTVSREMRSVFDRLGVNDATHAVYEAYRRHII